MRQGANRIWCAIYQLVNELVLSIKQFAHSHLFPSIQNRFTKILLQKSKRNPINLLNSEFKKIIDKQLRFLQKILTEFILTAKAKRRFGHFANPSAGSECWSCYAGANWPFGWRTRRSHVSVDKYLNFIVNPL